MNGIEQKMNAQHAGMAAVNCVEYKYTGKEK